MSAPIEPQGSALDELLSDEPLSAPARPSVLDSLRSSVGTDPTRYNQAVQEVPISASPRFAAENPEWYEDRDLKKQARLIEERPRLRQSLERDPETVARIGAGRVEQIARAHDTLQSQESPFGQISQAIESAAGQISQTVEATADQFQGTAMQYRVAFRANKEIADIITGSELGGALNRKFIQDDLETIHGLQSSMEGLSLAGKAVAFGTPQTLHMLAGLGSRAAAGGALSLTPAGPAGTAAGLYAGGAIPMVLLEQGLFYAESMQQMPEVPKEDRAAMSMMVGIVNGALELVPLEAFTGSVMNKFNRDAMRLLADRRFRDKTAYVLRRIGAQILSEAPTEAMQEVPGTLVPLLRQYAKGEIDFEGIIDGIEKSELGRRMKESAVMGAIGAPVPAAIGIGLSSIGRRGQVQQAQENRDTFQKIADAAVDNREIIDEMPERYHQLIEEAVDEDGQIEGIYINPDALTDAYEGDGAVELAQLLNRVPGLAKAIQTAQETGGKVRLSPADFATYVAPSERFQKLADDLSFNEDQGSLRESFEATKPENIEKIKAQLTLLREAAGVDPERDVALEQDFVQNLSAIFDETIPAVSAPVREKNAQLLGRIVMQISEMDGSDPLEAMSDLLDRVQFEQRPELDSPGEVQRSGQVLREGGDPQVLGQAASISMPVFSDVPPAGSVLRDGSEALDLWMMGMGLSDGTEVDSRLIDAWTQLNLVEPDGEGGYNVTEGAWDQELSNWADAAESYPSAQEFEAFEAATAEALGQETLRQEAAWNWGWDSPIQTLDNGAVEVLRQTDGGFQSVGNRANSQHLADSKDQVPTREQLKDGLDKNKKEKVEANRALKDNDSRLLPGGVAKLRIDIPFFNSTGQYAVTVHGSGSGVGKAIGYDSIVRLEGNVDFSSNEKVAKAIFEGKQTKTPIATVKGKLTQSKEIPDDIDDWVPVGYNPKSSVYFYDKRTGQEVKSGTDAISIGNTVYTRNPQYGARTLETAAPETFRQSVPEARVSTRRPTAKKSEEDALGEERLSVGISAVVDLGGDQLGKIATKIRGYTSLRPRQGESDIASVNRLKKIAKENLRWLWNQVDEDTRERTRHWYIGANAVAEEWGIRYGHSTEAISGTIAAMSPQKDWFMNVSLAERVLDVMHHDQDISLTDEEIAAAIAREIEAKKAKPEVERDALLADFTRRMEALRGRTLATITDKVEAAMFVRARSQAIHDPNFRLVSPEGAFGDVVMGKEAAKRIAWGSYQEIGRAIEILRNPSREVISAELGDQHKVRSFFNNIVDPTNSDDVTIDTHAVAAALLKPLSGKGLEVGHNFGVGPGNSSVSGVQGTYAIWADAYRELAEEFGVLPRELQSVTWEAARSLFTAGFKSQSDNVEAAEEIWSRYNSGKLSAPKARERINDIAGGLEQPESALAPRESSGPRTSFAAGVAGARDVAGQSAGRPAGTAAGTAGRSPNRVLGRVGEAGQVEATRDAPTVLKQDAADATNAAVDAFNRGDIGIFRQPAYHGSGSRFDKFSTDFMGTGEGAQAFGWGLYFSSSRGIAEFYRNQIAQPSWGLLELGGVKIYKGPNKIADYGPDSKDSQVAGLDPFVVAEFQEQMLIDEGQLFQMFNTDGALAVNMHAVNFVNGRLRDAREEGDNKYEKKWSALLKRLTQRKPRMSADKTSEGQLFEVDIPEDNELMNWDAPLSEQTPSVRAAIKSMPEAIGGLNDGLSQMTTEEISQMLYGIDPDGEFGQVDLDGEPITEEEWRDNLLESALSMDADGELTDFMFGDMDADGDQFGAGFYAQLATRLGSDRAASEALAAAGIKGHKYQANQISGGPGTATNFVIYDDAAISIAETFYSQSQEAKPSTRGQLIVDRRIQKFLLQLSEEKVNDSTLTHEIFHLALELVLDASERPGAGPEINEFREQILNFLNVDSREQIGRDQHERWAESGEVYMASGQAPTAELRNLFRFFFQRFKQVYRAIRDQLRNADPNNDFVPIFDRLLASEDQIRREANRDNVVAPMLAPELTELMTGPEEEELRRNLEAVNASERAKLESTIAKEDERILKAQMGELKTQVREEVYGRREHKLALWLRTGRTVTGDPIDDAIGLRVEGEHKMNGELLDEASGDVSTRKSLGGMVKVEGGLSPDAVAIAGGYNSTDEMLVELLAMEPSEDLIARIIHERAEVQGIVSTPEQLREAAAEKVDGQARDRLYAAQRRIARRLKGQMPAVDRVERKRLQGQAAPTVAEAKERVSAAQALLDESISQGADPGRIEGIQADIVAAEAGVVAAREARADQAQARRESRASRSKMPVQAIRAAARELVNELEFGQLKREMGRFKKMRAKASIAQTEAAVARDWDALEQAIDQEQLSNSLAEEAAKRLEDVNKYKRLIESFDKPKSSKRARLSKHGDYEDEDGAVTNVMDVIDGLLSMVSFKNISLRKIERAPNVALFAKLVEDSNGIVLPLPNWVSDVLDRPNYKKMKVSDLEDLYVGIKALEKFGMDMVLEREGIEKVAEQEEVDALLGTLEQQKPVLWAGKNKFGESQRSKSAKFFGGIIGAQMSFESTADLLDDLNPEGNFNRFFMHRFKAAAREEERLRKLVSQKVNAAWDKYSPIEKREFYSKPIKIHSLGESLTKNEIMAIAANMGNPHNRAAVMDAKAYGLTEVQIEEILSHVTERDADYLQSVLDAVNLLWEPAAAAEKEMNGVVPPKVQGVPWTLPSGRVMKGGYFPLMFDPALAERSAEHQAREIGKGLMPAGGGAAMTKVGSLKARKRSSGGLTIRTDFHAVLQKHVNSMSKDIAWRNTIVKADRQLRKLAPELKRVLGEPFYRQMRNYLKRQGTTLREGDQGPPDFVIKTARQARKGLGLTVMAWRLTQAAIQWSGFVTAIPRVGAANIAWGWADVTSTVWNWDRITQYRELIPELKNRAETFDRDAQQETLRLKPIDIRRPFSSLDTIQAFSANVGYTLLGMIDTVTSTAVAAGAMHQAMSGQVEGIAANDVEASVRYAGKIIDRTQGSGGAVNAPSMLDGGEMMKLLTPMMSFVNAQTQQAIVYGALGMRQVGDPTAPRSMIPGVPKEVARTVSYWFWVIVVEAILSEGTRYMINGLLGPDEPDEDAFFNTVIVRSIMGPLGGVPLLGEVESISRGFKPDTPLSSLLVTAYNATVKPAVDIAEGDYDGEKHIRALATGITYATGLPSKQALDAIEVLTQESFGRGR